MKNYFLIFFLLIFLIKTQIIVLYGQENSNTGSESPNITKKENKTFFSKINVEFSGYLSHSSYSDIILRANAIGLILKQYSNVYDITYGSSGDVIDEYKAIPLQLTLNYNLKEKIYLRAGLEYYKAINKFTQTHKVDWGQNNIENVSVDLDSNIQYFSPFIGAEYRFSDFGVYIDFNINFLKHQYIENIVFNQGSNNNTTKTDITATANPVGFKFGLKYSKTIYKKLSLFAKLEYSYSKISSFEGEKTIQSTNNSTINTKGIIYTYETNPYNADWIPTWDMLDNPVGNDNMKNINKMTMDLSEIRLVFGISF